MAINNALIGALRAEATLESGKFVDGARKLRTEATKTEAQLKKSFGGMATATNALKAGIVGFVSALSVGLITRAVSAGLQYAASLKEIALQLGVTTRDLQTFRFAAGQLGVKQVELDKGLENLTKTLGKLAAGAEAPRKALAAIGLSVSDLAGLDTGQAFRKIADALSEIPDRAQRAAVETALFGETGARLDVLLGGGSDAINQLSAAAEELGIVLSDEQIQKADETADKLEAIKTILSARLAGVVADNADAILKLADALMSVASAAIEAVNALGSAFSLIATNPFTRGALMIATGQTTAGAQTILGAFGGSSGSVTVKLPPPKPIGGAAQPGRNIGQFLAPKPKKARAPRAGRAPRDRSDDVEFQFAEELRRADMDILRAKRDLARTAEERYLVDLAILELERLDRDAELANRVHRAERDFAEGKITEAAMAQAKLQAEAVAVRQDEAAILKRQALDRERAQQQFEEQVRLEQVGFDLQQEALEAQLQLADTAAEERDIRLRLLELSYRQERARLQAVVADETASEAAKEDALARLRSLDALQAADTIGVLRSTRNPLEEWAASVPRTAAQITEAFQMIEAQGLDSLADAITDVISGTKSLGDAFSDVARSIINDIVQMTIRMLLFRAISGIFGGFGGAGLTGQAAFGATSGLPGFATGGSFNVLGRGGIDRNTLSLNGLPIARVSHGERISVGQGGGDGIRLEVAPSPYFDIRVQQISGQVVATAAPNIVRASASATMRAAGRPKLMGRR